MVEVSRLEHVQTLIKEGDTVNIGLEAAASALGLLGSTDSPNAERADRLARASGYVMQRLSEIFVRLSFLHWLRRQFADSEGSEFWRAFASLAVKDFHADVASLMDSVAPMIILIDNELKKDDRDKPPSFADVLASSKRTYRTLLADDVRALVDATASWWPAVKNVRDSLIHRKHYRIVFSNPQAGFYFQVYSRDDTALIDDAILKAPTGTQIVDFSLYSVWVVSEIIYFFDMLGEILAARYSLPKELLVAGGRKGDVRPFQAALQELIRRAGE